MGHELSSDEAESSLLAESFGHISVLQSSQGLVRARFLYV